MKPVHHVLENQIPHKLYICLNLYIFDSLFLVLCKKIDKHIFYKESKTIARFLLVERRITKCYEVAYLRCQANLK